MSQDWDAAYERRAWDSRVLQALRMGIREDLGPYAADSLELKRLNNVFGGMAFELSTYVLADRVGDDRIREEKVDKVSFPHFATWWDAFKATYRQRWWMRWRRWTVEYRDEKHELRAAVHVDLTRYHVFPHADVYPDQLGRPYRYIESIRSDPYGGRRRR